MATIYLSSTYEDLKDFRSAVVHALRQSEYRVIAMEDYVATDQRPADKCLRDVEQADIYVGLFAFRYGYVPPSEHNNPKGLSITELELRHAQHHKKPCLTFLADPKASGFPATLMDAFTGDGDAGKHIKRLRDELGREQTASFFSAPYQLASLVQAAVASYLAAHRTPASSSTPQTPTPTAITWDIKKNGSPYPGLMHFTRKYAPVFFGREAEIHDVLDRLRSPEGRFLIISGASGTGKSSLVDAGVLPKIETTVANEGPGYHSARMVPSRGRHPFDALMRPLHGYAEQAGVDAYTVSEQLLSQPNHLPQIFGEIASKCFKNAELVLFLDQMEELFTGQDRAQSHSFLSALYRTTQDAPLRIIATIRSDFLHHCHEQPDLLRMLNGQGHIGIGPIDAGSVREMILRPAQCAGLSLSEKLVRRVTDEAGHELGNLPLLAFALWQLFDKRAGKELTERAYDEMGGLAGAISQRADRVMTELGEEARNAFDKVFAQLVHLERERPPTRRRVSLMVFRSDAPANQLIETLAGPKCRILVKGGEGSEAMVEVAHEKLFSAWPKLKDWIDSSSADLRLIDYVEEAARRWYETGCHLEEVWRKERAEAVERALTRFKRMPSAQLYTMIHPQKMLIERLDDAALSHEDRLLIGQKLCEFGDTRDGVGLKDGLPDIVWIDIPGGSIILEEIDQVFEVKTFRIAKYPVTNLQFEAFISAQDGYRNKQWWNNIEPSEKARVTTWKETNAPRETVSWYEAVAFCRWLSAKTGKSIHLPTEWEWQQAATGGDPQRKYPWEGGWDGFRCNSWDSRLSRTTAVGIYPAGATTQGIYDMAGNVWEWCQNKYENPEGPEAVRIDKGGERVLRGGSWDSRPEYLLASYRDDRDDVVARGGGLGFRLVQDIP